MTPTLDELHRNPELIWTLQANARRERSVYVHCLMRKLMAALRPQPPVPVRTAPCA